MISEVVNIAAQCLKTPRKESIWSPRLQKYVCADSPDGQEAHADQALLLRSTHAPISSHFKLVFLTAFLGTLFFLTLCVVLTFATGREPNIVEKLTLGLVDLAQIGVGAVAGLLGGKHLQDRAGSAATHEA